MPVGHHHKPARPVDEYTTNLEIYNGQNNNCMDSLFARNGLRIQTGNSHNTGL